METETRHKAPDPVTMPDCISPVAATVWLGWQPVAQVQFSGSSIDSITYLTGDQVGSPRLGTNQSQDIVWRWDSDAFGSVEPATDPDGDGAHVNVENRFAGQYADGESGLRYNWNRYYDPVKGRYVTSDPIGLSGGVNTFGYVGGNPVMRIDPTGEAFPVAIIGGLAVVGAIAQGATTAINGGSLGDIGSAIVGGAILGAGVGIGAVTGTLSGMAIGGIIGFAGDAISAGGALGSDTNNPCQ